MLPSRGAPATSFGDLLTSKGAPATSFGDLLTSKGAPATSFGDLLTSKGARATSFGDLLTSKGAPATSFGDLLTSKGAPATSFGDLLTSKGAPATSFGDLLTSKGAPAISFGDLLTSKGARAISFGDLLTSKGARAISFGDLLTSKGARATSFGHLLTSKGARAISLGDLLTSRGAQATSFGDLLTSSGAKAIGMGPRFPSAGALANAWRMEHLELVAVERTAAVATVTIQRPDKYNALNARVVAELTQAFTGLAASEDPVLCAILTGAGKAFVAGADIAEMATLSTTEAKRFADAGHALGALLEALPFPVIAAVNGFALGGGCELALACDFIYAAEGAKIGQPEVGLGVIPGFGGTQRLLRRVGAARARELVYTGSPITAEQALAFGLVNAVFPGPELLLRARDTALKIASQGPLAVRTAKRVMLRGEALDLPAACELEAQAFAGLFGTEDQRAAMKAFTEKTKAAFTGK